MFSFSGSLFEKKLILIIFPLLFWPGTAVKAEECSFRTTTAKGQLKTIQGYYSSSFEHSGFNPCGMLKSMWWIDAVQYYDELNEAQMKMGGTKYEAPEKKLFIKAKACVSSEGQHGHMGAYTHLVEIKELIEFHPETGNDCTQ